MTTIAIFKEPQTESENGQRLASHMPQGRAWDNKNLPGTNMNGIVNGVASAYRLVYDKIIELAQDFDINNTSALIDEWEESVGIPDECVFEFTSLSERQQRVIQRLRKVPVVTLIELQEYLQAFFVGNTITIQNTTTSQNFEFTFELSFTNVTDSKFTLNINISSPTTEDVALLTCIARNVIPANVAIVINEV